MIKQLILNKRKLPVPIPIRTLGELVAWIESAMITKEHSVTRVLLDQHDIDLAASPAQWQGIALSSTSQVMIQADTPLDISIQTIDALKNLQIAVEKTLKPLAVICWQANPREKPSDLDMVLSDVDLMLDLLDHVYVLIENKIKASSNILTCAKSIVTLKTAIMAAKSQSDWKAVARLLLNRLEPSLVELSQELSGLEKSIFEYQADRSLGKVGQLG